jgi:hypothetical protein
MIMTNSSAQARESCEAIEERLFAHKQAQEVKDLEANKRREVSARARYPD